MVERGNDSYTSVTLPNVELEKQGFVNYNGSGLGLYFVMEYFDLEKYEHVPYLNETRTKNKLDLLYRDFSKHFNVRYNFFNNSQPEGGDDSL